MHKILTGKELGQRLRKFGEELDALQTKLDELTALVDARSRNVDRSGLRVDDLTQREVERLVETEGKRRYGHRWRQIVDRM